MAIQKDRINIAVKGIPTDVQQGQNSYKIQEQQANFLAMKATVQKTPGGVVAGFKVLGADPIEGSLTVDGPQVAIATSDVDGVKKTAALTVNTSSLSRKSGDGNLSVAVTQSTPDGIKKTMSATLKSAPDKITATIQSASPLPNTAKKAEKIDAKVELKKVNTDFAKKQMVKIKNPIGSTFANAAPGFSFANVLGTIASIVTGGNPMDVVGKVINDTTSFSVDPVSNQKVFSPIVNKSGTTNVSRTVSKGLPNNPSVQPTRTPFDAKLNYAEWLGLFTIGLEGGRGEYVESIYVFEQINSAEEWETDLINGLAEREITTMSIQWIGMASDQNPDIQDLQMLITKSQQEKYPKSKIRGNLKKFGIPINYIIKRDGTVYRGRPITIETHDDDTRAGPIVSIAMYGGSTEPKANPDYKKYYSKASVSAEQYRALDIGIQSFLKLVPGGEFVGGSELSEQVGKGPNPLIGPGFDVREYVRTKFGKDSVYDRDFDGVKSSADLAEAPAATVVEVEEDPSQPKPIQDIKQQSEKFDQLNKDTGKLKDLNPTELASKSTGFSAAAAGISKNIGLQNSGVLGDLIDVAKAVTAPLSKLLSAEKAITETTKAATATRQEMIERGFTYDKIKGEWVK